MASDTKFKIEPGESIFSTVLKETMPELFTGNGIWANPKAPRLADVLEGIITGGPDGEFLEKERERRTGVGLLPGDKASGKSLSLIGPNYLPDDERYPGPRPWSELIENERAADQWDLMLRNLRGLHTDPRLCRRCRRMCLVRRGTISDDQCISMRFTGNQSVRFRPFGTWHQLLLRTNCRICRLVVFSLSCGTAQLHPLLLQIDPQAQYSQLIPMTLPSGETALQIEYALRIFGVLRMITNENFREVLRQAYKVDDVDCPFDKLQCMTSVFHDPSGQSVSTKLLKNWINNCEKHHGGDCDQLWPSSEAGDERPIFLIDVVDQCLVETSMTDTRYFALSYVRGDTAIPITRLANIKLRQSRMSLPTELPKTIQEAIEIVRRLGERFLWVDALCIVQDDLNSKHSDIRRMDAIYSHAVVTFIALNGSNADAGLPGVRPGSRCPQHIECPPIGRIMSDTPVELVERMNRIAIEDPKQHELCLSSRHIGTTLTDEGELRSFLQSQDPNADLEAPEIDGVSGHTNWGMAAHPPSLKRIISISPWNSRAWTMQERLLSRRCIYFSHDYVYFQCSRETLSETGCSLLTWNDVVSGDCHGKEFARAVDFNPLLHFKTPSDTGIPKFGSHRTLGKRQDFDTYTELIDMYSRRQLSFPTDIVNAITGMLKVVHEQIGGDLIAGIPCKYLDLVMMWTPAEPLNRTTCVGDGANAFPSWSWAAWTARKQFRLASSWSGYDGPVREFATSEIDCFKILHDGELLEISKTKEEMAAMEILDPSTAQDRSHELEIRKYVPYSMLKTHGVLGPDFGPNVLQFWAYATHGDSFQYADIEGTLISEPEHGNQRGQQYVNSLLDPRRKHCGLEFKPQSRSQYRERINTASLEYVLISSFGDSERARYGIETIDQSVKPFDPRAFPWRGKGSGLVNVMLIEWFGDVAERLTVAQINRQAWENARPVLKHIRLA